MFQQAKVCMMHVVSTPISLFAVRFFLDLFLLQWHIVLQVSTGWFWGGGFSWYCPTKFSFFLFYWAS